MRAFDANYIPRRDAVIAAGIAAVLGAIAMAMLMTGYRIPFKCLEAGDASNWLAAFGTWIIGAGAWRYAGEANKLRIFEVKTERLAGIEARLFALNGLMVSFDIVKYCMTLFDEDSLEDGQCYTADGLARSARVGLKQIERIDWMDRGGIVLDIKIIDAMNAFTLSIDSYREACRKAIKVLSDYEEEVVDAEAPFLVMLLDEASTIRTEAARIFAMLEEEDERCETERERVRSGRLLDD